MRVCTVFVCTCLICPYALAINIPSTVTKTFVATKNTMLAAKKASKVLNSVSYDMMTLAMLGVAVHVINEGNKQAFMPSQKVPGFGKGKQPTHRDTRLPKNGFRQGPIKGAQVRRLGNFSRSDTRCRKR